MPGSLTSLADCKAWLGLTTTTDDALLATLAGAVSQAILADLGRAAVLPSTYVDTLDGGGAATLTLRQWPATRLLSCTIDGVPQMPAPTPTQPGLVLEAADAAPPGSAQRLHYRGGAFARGTQNVSVTYRAGYEIIGEMTIVPTALPFTVTALGPYGVWQTDSGVTGADSPYGAASGTYTFTAADAGKTIGLSYGYVPADLARAACEWVADRYASRTRIGQSAKTLGGQETASFIVKSMPDVVDRLLRPYRRVAG